MKTLNITFEDEEIEWLERVKAKEDFTWREMILYLSNYTNGKVKP